MMKAMRISEYGGLDVLLLNEVPRPAPAADEILIRLYASGVNLVDCVIREGGNEVLKPMIQLPMTLGCDAAGVIEEIGSAVTAFQPGDAVYGIPNFPGNGSYAQFMAAKASQFARKPVRIDYGEASAIPLAGLTAWTGLFADGKLESGQRLLINGAAGGVGSFAVQFAKARGAYVIGTASAGNHAYLRELGADEVLDYRQPNYADGLDAVDVVFDASPVRSDDSRRALIRILKPGGILVSSQVDFPYSAAVQQDLENKRAAGELVFVQFNGDWLREIAELVDAGQVKVSISKTYPLEQAAAAQREVETGHVRGKLVLDINHEG
ncbi:MAG: NADP-dependent oxidoreductase [Lewinella sp.]